MIDQLAETEYYRLRDPHQVRLCPFGEFVHISGYPSRHDATLLLDVRCSAGQVDALLDELEALYRPLDLSFRKLVTHDRETASALQDELKSRGWITSCCYIATADRTPVRRPNPEVEVRSVPFDHPHLKSIVEVNDGTDNALPLRGHHDRRIGGELLIGYLDGEPAGTPGWFVTPGNVARFRAIDTVEPHRGRGVATTLVQHVRDHQTVRSAHELCLFCREDGPWPLYRRLGFRERGRMWEFRRDLSS